MKVDLARCKGCGICAEVCPRGIIGIEKKKVRIGEGCVECRTCMKVCPQAVFSPEPPGKAPSCTACPIACRIPEGFFGACMRYYNDGGTISRKARVHTYEEVADMVESAGSSLIERPLLTGIGSGTTYPDFKPSPFIVSGVRDGIDIVTVVTEAPLSYSGVKVKIDTDRFIGEESKHIYVKRKGKRQIGHLCTEEYGSKMLSLGGINTLTSKDALFAAKAIFEVLQGQWVTMEIEDGSKIEIALDKAPKIDGVSEERMRVGCGSACSGLFAPYMNRAADEVIVLDGHITGLFSEHPAGREIGKARSGVSIVGQKSTEGRYFVGKGKGWGGTDIKEPLDVISEIDRDKMPDGMSILITETTGRNFAFYRMRKGVPVKEAPSPEALSFLEVLADSCEKSKVSAVLAAGVGGSARAGVTKNPIKLTRAVHEGRVAITIGGARPFILPGGGINFLVDVGKIKHGSIYLSPTPSFVLPVEYTMRRDTFAEIGGHVDSIRPIESVLKGKARKPRK
jgi:NAD-dependent dihydropyrimidine dehydrogenase PreA subunit